MKNVDWKAFCRDHGLKTDKLRNHEWLICQCPFHNDNHPSGAVNVKTGSFHCWTCGTKSMFDFVSTVAGCAPDARDVFNALDPYTNGAFRPHRTETPPEQPEPDVSVEIERGLKMPGESPLAKPYRRYLKKRGLVPDYMEKHYGLKGGGIAGPWGYRLMIPFYENGKLVCWQGRHIGDDKIRYRTSDKKTTKNIKECVYNIDNAPGDTAIVVEGVFDVFKIGPGAVCLCGISVTSKQLVLLAERFKHVYMMFDSEPEAQRIAKLCQKKLVNMGVHCENICATGFDGKDAGDMGLEEILQIREELLGDTSHEAPWIYRRKTNG